MPWLLWVYEPLASRSQTSAVHAWLNSMFSKDDSVNIGRKKMYLMYSLYRCSVSTRRSFRFATSPEKATTFWETLC
jgi:hypothetical protein